ncbi:hypothetical protein SDC9_109769 [bioreactor metagenome]|uniref:GtrA/DPMS transmembrane domain-containing protein n=1 Tax=bioreactor metagenome TaxID=1076179 RepID=A0A645BE19_9ZZZZ
MKKKKEYFLNSPLWQFAKFCIVGVSNTLVNLAVYYVIIVINSNLYLVANIVAWFISVLNAFCWSNRFVFSASNKDKKSILLRLGKTYLVYGATMLLATVLLRFEVEVWGISKAIAPIINVALFTPINFLLNKFWTFAGKMAGKKTVKTDEIMNKAR